MISFRFSITTLRTSKRLVANEGRVTCSGLNDAKWSRREELGLVDVEMVLESVKDGDKAVTEKAMELADALKLYCCLP